MLGPSTAIWLRKMIVSHMPGGRAPLESGLGAKPSYAGVTIAILGNYYYFVFKGLLSGARRSSPEPTGRRRKKRKHPAQGSSLPLGTRNLGARISKTYASTIIGIDIRLSILVISLVWPVHLLSS